MSNSSALRSEEHKSVMMDEVIKYMSPNDGDIIIDGTFGAGGHTSALLESANCTVVGIDRDDNAKRYVDEISHKYSKRFVFIEGKFGDMESLLKSRNIDKVDGILLDIGVSSMQIDNGDRGFSFQKDGPLDMRMASSGETAADVVNNYSEENIADIIFKYGDERKSRRIAKAIINYREENQIETTLEFAEIIKKSVGRYNDTIHPATRSFQALRIYVNDELRELERALAAAENLLSEGGKLVVITFHSGEDVILKQFLQGRSGRVSNVSRHLPVPSNISEKEVTFEMIVNKAIKPSKDEVSLNARARSAKMRVAKRVNVSPDSLNVQVGE